MTPAVLYGPGDYVSAVRYIDAIISGTVPPATPKPRQRKRSSEPVQGQLFGDVQPELYR